MQTNTEIDYLPLIQQNLCRCKYMGLALEKRGLMELNDASCQARNHLIMDP